MKIPSFTYASPSSVDEALALLAPADPATAVLAGGQSLLPELARRDRVVARVVDIGRIAALRTLSAGAATHIGATVTQLEVQQSPVVAARHPALVAALASVGTEQVRARGTLCGSIAQGDPSAELPAVLAACDATAVLVRDRSSRRVRIDELYSARGRPAIGRDELLTEIVLPPAESGWLEAFAEVGRRSVDVATVAAVVRVRLGSGAIVDDARVACTARQVPGSRLAGVEAALRGVALGREALRAATRAAASVELIDDAVASSAYRSDALTVLVRRCLERIATVAVPDAG